MLTNVASNLSPSVGFTHDIFSMELIFRSSVLDSIMYHDNKHMICLLNSKKNLKGSVIDDEQHEVVLQDSILEEKPKLRDPFPMNIVRRIISTFRTHSRKNK